MEKDTRSMLEWTRDIWKKHLHVLPVHKDFPRLSCGLEIVDGDSNRILFKDSKDKSEIGVKSYKEILWHLAVLLPDKSDKDLKKENRKELKHQREGKKKKKVRREIDEYSEREIGLDDSDSDEIFVIEGNEEHEKEKEQGRTISPDFDSTVTRSKSLKILVTQPRNYQNETNVFANNITEKYEEIIKDHSRGDIAVKMDNLFRSGVFDPDGKFSKILKCIQQEILCPAVMDLHTKVYSDFPYKDVKGTWIVRIEFYFQNESSHDSPSMEILPLRKSKSPIVIEGRKSRIDKEDKSKSSTKVMIPDRIKLNRSSSLPAFEARAKLSSSPKKKSVLGMTVNLHHNSILEKSSPTPTPSSFCYRPIRKIRVLHRKREQSYDLDPASHFEFEWELGLDFDTQMEELLQVSIQVIDVSTAKGVPKEKKEDLINILANYMSPAFPFVMIWKRSAKDLSLLKDIPSILKSLSVIDLQGRKINEGASIYHLIHTLSQQLSNGEDILTKSDPKVANMIMGKSESNHHFTKSLKNFLSSVVEGDNQISRILKSTSKEILVPASSKVKNIFKPIAKECKEQSWNVVLQFSEHVISVTHFIACTCNLQNSNDQAVEIEWKLTLTFDLNMEQLLTAKTEIVTYLFIGDITIDKKQLILDLMSPLVTPDTMENSKIMLPIPKIMASLFETFSKLPEDQLQVDGILPGCKISVFDLLQSLDDTMKSENIERVRVTKLKNINI